MVVIIASNAQNHKIYNKVKIFIITENIDQLD